MNSKRVEEVMQSHGVINITYNGMPVWIEGVRGDLAQVTLIDAKRRMEVPVSGLAEADSIQSL